MVLRENESTTESYLPLSHTDLTEQTYDVLKEMVLKRQLEPGHRISVEEIAHGLGVSRTPVTDALKRLAVEGLVEIQPRRGTFVTELTARDVSELFDIRLIFELHAARVILDQNLVEEFLDAISEPISQMRQATVNDSYGDYEAFIAADRSLHAELVGMSGNQRMSQMYTDLNVHMRVARAHHLNSVENARQAHQEHEDILRAFESRDASAIEGSLTQHITNVKARILELLDARGGKL
jgi:DNA-binding GntR family transcriptional regulator